MKPNETPQPAAAIDTLGPQHPDSHYQHLKNTLPQWLGQASSTRRLALKNTQPRLPDRLKTAPAAQHQEMKALNAAHWTAQNDVDKRLADLQDASAFAEPLLTKALKIRFGLDLNVRTTFVRLYVPATTPGFSVKTGARAWTVSLLDAALHNFEEKEAQDSAYETESNFITAPSATEQFDTLPWIKEKLTVPAFIQLCRSLDIGAQYKTYLEDNLGITNPVAAAVLQLKVNQSQKAALKAALQLARMNGDIGEQYFRLIGGLVDGLQGMRLNGQALFCHDLTMLDASLTGIVIFAPDLEQSRGATRIVAYVPDDPEHPIKEYASSSEMAVEMTRQLRSKDYQQFFSRFVDHEQRGFFFGNLNSRLTKITWHEPLPGSALPTWRETPIDNPNLQLAIQAINSALWQHLYQGKLNKILNDARVIAVATATADQKARWALWDSFVSIASAIVQAAAFIVAPFVPVLGEMMMAYMAYQMLEETFEGIIDWAEGLTTEAFEHLMGTVESLLQLGVFAAGGAIGAGEFRKVLPKEIVAFIDGFKSVERPDGQSRYWKPDLAPYEQNSAPASGSRANELGLHRHQDKHLLPIDQAHFAVSEGPIAGQYRIDHPTRPEAYKPVLRHNGQGAWHTELEQPLEWDTPTALRRIGSSVETFTPAQREQILKVSGYSEDGLRRMHVDQEPLPPLLADSIQRFKIDQDLQQFIDQLDSDLPEQYRNADPLTQLQMLVRHDRWPPRKRLQWLNAQGDITWTSSADETFPLTVLRHDDVRGGVLLETLLLALDESEVKSLLGEEFNGPRAPLDVRSQALRKQLAHIARQHRTSLFESRYAALQQDKDPLVRQIAQHHPQLPASIQQQLLNTATDAELQQISEGQLPERQQELVELANREVRVARAYEGLALASVDNPDTHTLALHSLRQLPGWTGEVRIEVRDRNVEGPVMDSTGRADAPAQKVLVRLADGTWQPYDDRGQELHAPTDFYSSVLYALPDAERKALDIQIGQGQNLKEAIRARPLQRSELRLAISPTPITPPAVDTLRLVGADGYRQMVRPVGALRTRVFTLQERVREVYPGHSHDQIQALLASLRIHPGGARAELSRLHSEYTRLTNDLHRWANDIPVNDPATGAPLSALKRSQVQHNRAQIRDAIQRCWRKETREELGYTLQIPAPMLGDLPVLSADFSHVHALSINGAANNAAVDAFLQNFPGLLHLDIQNLPLRGLPSALTSMPNLRRLVVRHGGITLSAGDQQILSSLRGLTSLYLLDNPLTVTPDIQALPSLQQINLANTGITTVPAGLLDHPNLISGRFEGNQITELPAALFTHQADPRRRFDFSDNPLSATTRERIKAHYARSGRHFGVLAEQADIDRTTALFPDHDAQQATDLLYRLPGTLDQSRARLSEWEAEIARLTADLAQWSADVPQRHLVTDKQLTIPEVFAEQVAREAFSRTLEQAWRNRLSNPADGFRSELKFMGQMPVFSADFSHVTTLGLTGNSTINATSSFLQNFPGLRGLHLNNFALDQIPQAITHLPLLETLVLDDCGVSLTPPGQAALASLPNLQTLELTNNPLGEAPDLTTLPGLRYIDLSHTGIATVPSGLADHPNLRTAIFTHNAITELPEALFSLPANRIDAFDFAQNPFSMATQERIKTCFQSTGQDFGFWADQADIDLTIDLFPALDAQDASDVIYELPGTLEDGRVQLRHWKAEFTQLSQDLTRWTTDIPDHHPVSKAPLTADQMFAEHVSREEFKQKLEQFWGRRTEPSRMRAQQWESNLTFWGDMPPVTADFSHVYSLTLNGNSAIGDTAAFLELFPNLHTLNLQNFTLGQLPAAMTRMPNLKELSLRRCGLALTPEGQAVLSSLSKLEVLDLSDNPLAITPDLTALSLLRDIRLSKTGITQLPNGFTALKSLQNAFLDGNRIRELPDELFSLELDLLEDIDLADNPLSPESRNQIKAHYANTGDDFNILAEQADIHRLQALFSGLDTEDASHVIYKLPGTLEDGRAQLTRWEVEIGQLTRDLKRWAEEVPTQHPDTGQPLSAIELSTQRSARDEFSQKLRQFWRQRIIENTELRMETFEAQLTFIGELPQLTADLSHVSTLTLIGNDALVVPSRLLECFSGVNHLELRNFALGRMPQAITAMPSLKNLVLSQCGLVLDTEGLAALYSRPRLEMLELFDNPLGMIPDVAKLPTLKFIDLSSTAIDRVPNGLSNHPALETAILTGNRITELPDEIFNVPREIADGFDFNNNPLSATTRERIKTCFSKTGIDLGVLAPQADVDRSMALYPNLDSEQASEFIYRLPGSLVDGRVELARKETELASLISDLDVWVTDIPDHSDTGEALSAADLLREQLKRREFKESLERCWRQVPTENAPTNDFGFRSNLPIMGDLPVLTADFGHVLELYLTSTGNITPRLNRFLDYFPNLNSLAVRGYQLGNIPDAIFSMPRLNALSLPECRITLTRQTADALAGMENLDSLNLRNNPLGLTPDLRNMRELSSLDLSSTGLSEIPKGLLDSRNLFHADLSDNAITHMPSELMETHPANTADFNFSGNPFTTQSLERIAAYFHETGNTLGIDEVAGMPRPGNLPPDLDMES
ncbi:MAG TPA: DUF6543 domain-containing protein [Pseudomonas sp.]|nr:DUF6543 domain-containing protein [Pseudomonas sp.]